MSSSKYDQGGRGFEEEDESKKPKFKRDKQGYMRQEGLKYEFDCPECNANNPWDEGFTNGSELQCHYCGQDFRAIAVDEKRFRFKAL